MRIAIPLDARLWVHIPVGPESGVWAHLDPRFEMEYASGTYEFQVQRELLTNLQPGSVFYDVGAHIGIVSMFAAQVVGAEGAVFAFEADPENARRIEEHILRNGLKQISLVQNAVWSSAGRLRFERASERSSRNQGAVSTGPNPSTGSMVEVEAIALISSVWGKAPVPSSHAIPATATIPTDLERRRPGETRLEGMAAPPLISCARQPSRRSGRWGGGRLAPRSNCAAIFGVGRSGGIEKTSLISLTSEERRTRPHLARA